ncbi:MAG: TfoX/Sxy family protein [Gemmatimonadetes bacterium]|nr:TfoX/Sxy family protein [Gemmatimonadota bacterium]MBK7830829.1 TfoX/Sxy family protein [Gemmatimonadota bacterium]
MPFDAGLVERVRDALARLGERGSRERRVFSGYGFLQGKNTFVIVWSDGIIVKMTPEEYPAALRRPGVTPFAPDGERPMGTWVYVREEVIADDPELAEWVAMGLQGVRVAPAPAAEKKARGKPTGASPVTKQSSFREKRVAKNASSRRKRLSKKASPRGKRR